MTAVGVSGALEFCVKGTEAPRKDGANKGVFQKIALTMSSENELGRQF